MSDCVRSSSRSTRSSRCLEITKWILLFRLQNGLLDIGFWFPALFMNLVSLIVSIKESKKADFDFSSPDSNIIHEPSVPLFYCKIIFLTWFPGFLHLQGGLDETYLRVSLAVVRAEKIFVSAHVRIYTYIYMYLHRHIYIYMYVYLHRCVCCINSYIYKDLCVCRCGCVGVGVYVSWRR